MFKIDVTICPHCGGNMAAVCSVMERDSVVRYLKHMKVDYEPPPRAPHPKRCAQDMHHLIWRFLVGEFLVEVFDKFAQTILDRLEQGSFLHHQL